MDLVPLGLSAYLRIQQTFATTTVPGPTSTVPGTKNEIKLFDPLDGQGIEDLVNYVINGLTALAIPVVSIMVIIGAYYLITSGGNPGRRQKGKDFILWAVIGFAILLLASSITAILKSFLES
jgi:predicted cobalt transporter CbtA